MCVKKSSTAFKPNSIIFSWWLAKKTISFKIQNERIHQHQQAEFIFFKVARYFVCHIWWLSGLIESGKSTCLQLFSSDNSSTDTYHHVQVHILGDLYLNDTKYMSFKGLWLVLYRAIAYFCWGYYFCCYSCLL